MLRIRPVGRRRPGPLVEGLQPHEMHEPADPLPIDALSLGLEPDLHPTRAKEGRLQVLAVHGGHERQVRFLRGPLLVVQRRPADPQELALACDGQATVLALNEALPLLAAHCPDLLRKKSRSTVSWPICR